MVTVDILKAAGYPVSNLKDENVISLAERDVISAYFPDTETFESDDSKELLYALTFSLLLKRKIQATRYGSVQKVSQYSIAAEAEQIKTEIRSYCRIKLEKYEAATGHESMDILEMYDKIIAL